MKLLKKEELLALGSALYLVGLEVEGNRSKLQEITDNTALTKPSRPPRSFWTA